MVSFCPSTSLGTLQPLCYCGMHLLQGYLCHYFHEGSRQAVQVVVTLSACHVLQNSPQFIVQGVEVWTPRGPILAADKGWNVPLQPLISHLGLLGRNWVLLEDPFLTTGRVMLRYFTTPCSTSSGYTWTPVSLLFCKNEDVPPPNGTPAFKPWCRKGDGICAPSEHTSRDIRA